MNVNIGVVMDPIHTISFKKDTTLALLLAAQARGWNLHYFEPSDLYLQDGQARGRSRLLSVADNPDRWYTFGSQQDIALEQLTVILMRKDPPFDMQFVYQTYILEQAERRGTLVVNKPQSLRDANEKLFTAWFPQCCPPSVVSRDQARLRAFLAEQRDIIVKPPDGMGGARIFRLRHDDPNIGVILETLTEHGQQFVIAQRYLPEISSGDKRILLIDGQPIPYALARMAASGETRANLAAGGHGVGVELTDRDRWICDQVGPELRQRGLIFVGLDVIGDYLTEINVTSPTCVRELNRAFDLDIGGELMTAIERRLR